MIQVHQPTKINKNKLQEFKDKINIWSSNTFRVFMYSNIIIYTFLMFKLIEKYV